MSNNFTPNFEIKNIPTTETNAEKSESKSTENVNKVTVTSDLLTTQPSEISNTIELPKPQQAELIELPKLQQVELIELPKPQQAVFGDLSILDLSQQNLTDEELEEFYFKLEEANLVSQLKEINLSCNNLTARAIENVIAPLISKHKNIKVLNLAENDIDDSAIGDLITAIASSPLEILNLSKNCLGTDSILVFQYLFGVASTLRNPETTVKFIDLSDNNLIINDTTADLLKEFCEANDKLDVNLDGITLYLHEINLEENNEEALENTQFDELESIRFNENDAKFEKATIEETNIASSHPIQFEAPVKTNIGKIVIEDIEMPKFQESVQLTISRDTYKEDEASAKQQIEEDLKLAEQLQQEIDDAALAKQLQQEIDDATLAKFMQEKEDEQFAKNLHQEINEESESVVKNTFRNNCFLNFNYNNSQKNQANTIKSNSEISKITVVGIIQSLKDKFVDRKNIRFRMIRMALNDRSPYEKHAKEVINNLKQLINSNTSAKTVNTEALKAVFNNYKNEWIKKGYSDKAPFYKILGEFVGQCENTRMQMSGTNEFSLPFKF